MLGIHHVRHPLQRRDNHGLFPFLQIIELLGEFSQQRT